MLEEFKNGQTLLVRATFLKRDRRDMDFTLSGFSRNLDEMQRNLLQ